MLSPSFVDHTPHLFFGSLGVAFLVGLARSLPPRLTRERRLSRLLGIPLVYFVLLMALAHAASFAGPSFEPAMAVAMVSPVSRLTAVRKLGSKIRESEKTERDVETLIALDLAIHDCPSAESDAYRYRARATWSKVNMVCGPSESAARSLYEDGKLEEAAQAFEAARKARPDTRLAIDELTAYVLTKRATVAGAALRASKTKLLFVDDLKCLADAVEVHAGVRTEWSTSALSPDCATLREHFGPGQPVPSPPRDGRVATNGETVCVPHRNTEARDHEIHQQCGGDGRFHFDEPIPVPSEADDPIVRAAWLTQLDDPEGALEVMDRALRTFTWEPPAYTQAQRDEHASLLAAAQDEDPGLLWIRADCTQEIRVPAHHRLVKRVEADRALYDSKRDLADQANLALRDEALRWAHVFATDGLDGVRAQGYLARHSARPSTPGDFTTWTPDVRLSLLLAHSSESARRAFEGRDQGLIDAAVAGSGTRLASRLRALDDSGQGTLDVLGKTIPEGRTALQSFSRYDARLDCHRRTYPMDQRGPRCTPLSLVRALGERHRNARAVDDRPTVRETREALDRMVQHEGGAWLKDQRLARLIEQADRMLTVPESSEGSR